VESVAVIFQNYILGAVIEHRFDGYHHARHELGPRIAFAEIRHIRVLMDRSADTVPGEDLHNAVSVWPHEVFYRMTDVPYFIARHRGANANFERFGCDSNEFL